MNNMCLSMVMLLKQSKLYRASYYLFLIFIIELEKPGLGEVFHNELKVYKFILHIINKLERMESENGNGLNIDGQLWQFSSELKAGDTMRSECISRLVDYIKKIIEMGKYNENSESSPDQNDLLLQQR